MTDIQLDVASANRFISSLSKSLQALCHGCMDFDAGIEIVGYINVNIDSGSKVDYVLNEKVLKSTTNSMTFVSNSFLAKKDQPKSCRDGSCSPIPELNFSQRTHGSHSYPATQMYRSSGIYSPHSQVLRGSQKRSWPGGDWRMSPRKFARGAKSQYPQYSHQTSSQNDTYSNQMPDSEVNISTQQQEYDNSVTQQKDVNIKQEVDDNINDNYQNVTGGESSNETNGVFNAENIKTDPDGLSNQDTADNFPTKSETDISDSFLQPSKTDETNEGDPTKAEENRDDSATNYEDSSTTHAENKNTDDTFSQGPSGAEANYDGSCEMFPQSSYSEEGTSGEGGQFEVIEIDDEDEDVAAMFDESHRQRTLHASGYNHDSIHGDGGNDNSDPDPCLRVAFQTKSQSTDSRLEASNCSYCHKSFTSSRTLFKHMEAEHSFPSLSCPECGNTFPSKRNLQQHLKCHQSPQFKCAECGSKFKLKHHLKRHKILVHGLMV